MIVEDIELVEEEMDSPRARLKLRAKVHCDCGRGAVMTGAAVGLRGINQDFEAVIRDLERSLTGQLQCLGCGKISGVTSICEEKVVQFLNENMMVLRIRRIVLTENRAYALRLADNPIRVTD